MSRITYQFVASGADDVKSAFKGIAAAAREADRASRDASKSVYGSSSRAPSGRTSVAGSYRVSARDILDNERLAIKSADREARARERALQSVARVRDRYFLDQQRQEERSVRATEIANRRVAEDRIRTISRVASRVGNMVYGIGERAVGKATDVIGSAVRETLQLSEISNRVSINARMAGKEAVNPNILQHEFQNIAISTPGIKANDVAEAAQAYVDLTGDLATARENMQSFATTASATGAKITDVATAAASLGSKFNVKSTQEMQQVMASLAFQGKGGAMTLKDIASQFQKLAAAGAAFDIGRGAKGVAVLGGLVQIARTGTKSPLQAGTAVENVFANITAKSNKLAGFGVNVYDKGGNKRSIVDVLTETVSKAGGSSLEKKNAALIDIFGKQGIRAINPLIAEYTTASKGLTGEAATKAGASAVRAMLEKAINLSADWGEIQKDAEQAQNNASAKFSAAMEQLKGKVGDKLIPALLPLIDKVPALVDALDPLIGIFKGVAEGAGSLLEVMRSFGLVKGEAKPIANGAAGVGAVVAEKVAGDATANVEHPAAKAMAATIGGMFGAVLGGKPGAALGAGAGYGLAGLAEAGANAQNQEFMSQRRQGFIETESGATINVGELTPGSAGREKQRELDSQKIQKLEQGFDSVAKAASMLAAKLSETSGATAGNL